MSSDSLLTDSVLTECLSTGGLSTKRVALVVTYNGALWHGFQLQAETIPTVQGCLESALAQVANHNIKLKCAGRTDTGVHATHQVVHFDTSAERPDKAWIHGTNGHLPDSISIVWAGTVPNDFDARFSATARRYLYLIYNSPVRSALCYRELTREYRDLNEALMARAGALLVGEHDFSAYRASACQARTPIRTVQRLEVYRRSDIVAIDITANGFLHHMVRNIVGVLLDIGTGVAAPEWAGDVLATRDRRCASMTAPPTGLYLIDVSYPQRFGVPPGPSLPHLYSTVAN